VELEKINERTVRFRLDQPYSFFPSNLTLGILPAQSFAGVPVSRLRETVDFGLAPIGAGPYAFRSFVQTERSSEVTLERYARPGDTPYYLERIILRIFPDYSSLLSDVRNIDGVRIVPRNERGDPVIPRPFTLHQYVLPQYVALFFNLERPILQDRNLRLGMQLGTDKQRIVDTIHESLIIDTPLLEIDTSDWRYHFDAQAAQGALFESNWYLPEKLRLQRLLERAEVNQTGPLHIESVVLLDTGAILAVTGSLTVAGTGARLNGALLHTHPTLSGAWIAALATASGTGSLQSGDNIVRLTKADGTVIDSIYVWRATNNALYRQAIEEERLVNLFLRSREASTPVEERITVSDLILERGMLRKRLATDSRDIRINESGERLSLVLITSPSPVTYRRIAEDIQKQWSELGVHVSIEIPDTQQEFEQRLLKREYDVLLFGQSLLDNLDSYPYWHSSAIQKLGGSTANLRLDAYNLSQYASQRSDHLLETIRETGSEKERESSLRELREVLANDVPAIFLYSPLYTFGVSQEVSGVHLGKLSLHSDRFLTLYRWYINEDRTLKPGVSWWSFLSWLSS
jgi:ABC-type transport system substrate-binding protein